MATKAKFTPEQLSSAFVHFACENSLAPLSSLARNRLVYTLEQYPVWIALHAVPLDGPCNRGGGISQMLYDAITHATGILIKAHPDNKELFMWFKWFGHFNAEADGCDVERYEQACERADNLRDPAFTFVNSGALGEKLSFKCYAHEGGYLCIARGGEMIDQLFAFWLGDDHDQFTNLDR